MDLNVKALRTKYGYSQRELSDKTGIPEHRINAWEQNKGKPKFNDSKILLEFFEKLEGKVIENTSRETSGQVSEPEEVYRNIVEGNTEYVLIPRAVLNEKYRLVAIEQIQKDAAFTEALLRQIDKLTTPVNVQKSK